MWASALYSPEYGLVSLFIAALGRLSSSITTGDPEVIYCISLYQIGQLVFSNAPTLVSSDRVRGGLALPVSSNHRDRGRRIRGKLLPVRRGLHGLGVDRLSDTVSVSLRRSFVSQRRSGSGRWIPSSGGGSRPSGAALLPSVRVAQSWICRS